jgi:FkbM family methyltransferase
LRSNEVFVDCGAFDGDTLDLFLRKSKFAFTRAFAFEPDPANFARLSDAVAFQSSGVKRRIEIKRAAVGEHDGTVRFSAEGTASSSVGKGDLEVECIALDQHLRDCDPTIIKMDIEGAEPGALRGAARLIREKSPLLAISCYHQQDHLWSIPLLIQSLNPNYRFYLRPHDLEGWDLVCYAIPSQR